MLSGACSGSYIVSQGKFQPCGAQKHALLEERKESLLVVKCPVRGNPERTQEMEKKMDRRKVALKEKFGRCC